VLLCHSLICVCGSEFVLCLGQFGLGLLGLSVCCFWENLFCVFAVFGRLCFGF